MMRTHDDYMLAVFWNDPDPDAAVCWYNGPECDGGLGGLSWDRDKLHLVCEKCRETEGHDDDDES